LWRPGGYQTELAYTIRTQLSKTTQSAGSHELYSGEPVIETLGQR
jgi:hypothetical protein